MTVGGVWSSVLLPPLMLGLRTIVWVVWNSFRIVRATI
jgi:hypothetical protein